MDPHLTSGAMRKQAYIFQRPIMSEDYSKLTKKIGYSFFSTQRDSFLKEHNI